MSNIIKIKAGSGLPTTSDIVDREMAFDRANNKLYINDSGTIIQLTGSGGSSSGSADESNAITFTGQAGEDLSKGDVVYISGLSGNTPVVSKADADDSSKMPAYGVASTDASLNNSVSIITSGALENFDTSAFSQGNILYVNTTAGTFTQSPPTGESSKIQNIAFVVRSHASTGAIKVDGAGRSAATPNLNQDKIFLGNSSNQSVSTALSSIGLSKFNNDSGFTTNTGDVEGVTAGTGLSGGGTSGTVNLDIDLTEVGFGGGANRLITDDGDGTVSTEANLTFDGTNLDLPDSKKVRFGTDNDFEFYHDDTNAVINNTKGDLQIYNNADDKNIVLLSDDGSGGTTAYITLRGDLLKNVLHQDTILPATKKLYFDGGADTYITETSADLVDLYVGGQNALRVLESSDVSYAYVPDSQFLGAGTSIDFTMNHDGINSQLTNNTGDLYITNNDNDKDIIFRTDDGSGGLTPYLTLDGSATDIKIAQHMQFADNKELRIGNDNDLRLVSNNSNTFIDNYLGSMFIRQTVDDQDIIFQCDNGSGGLATYITLDGSTTDLLLSPPNNVGIGTNSPETNLHIGSGTQSVAALAGVGIANGASAYSFFSASDGTKQYIAGIDHTLTYSKAGTLSNHDHSIITNNVERIYIKNTGNVGIGTDSPGLKLDVAGDIGLKNNSTYLYFKDASGTSFRGMGINSINNFYVGPIDSFAGGFMLYGASANTSGHVWYSGNAEAMRIDSSQNVGIGTNLPGAKLDVTGSNDTTNMIIGAPTHLVGGGSLSEHQSLLFDNTNVAGASGQVLLRHYANSHNDSEGALAILTTSTGGTTAEAMRIRGSGNVGIGTSSPLSKLHIEETTNDADALMIRQVAGGSGSVQGKVHIGMNHFNSTYPSVRITAEEYGVADYRGNLAFSTRAATSDAVPTEKMRITHDGNVGIGVTSPTEKLQVDGNIKIEDGGTYPALLFDDVDTGAYIANNANGLFIGKTNSPSSTNDILKLDLTYSKLVTAGGYFEIGGGSSITGILGFNRNISTGAIHNGSYGAYQMQNEGGTFRIQVYNSSGGSVNANAFVIKDTANVGIGETSPEAKLHIKNASAGTFTASNSQLLVENNTTVRLTLLSPAANGCKIEFGDINDQDVGMINYDHSNNYMAFTTNATEAMRIDNSQDAHFDQDVIAFSTTPSDIRLKENFEKIENGLDVVSKLEGHTFNWKKGGDRLSAGFKAQEVEKILPHLVDEKKLPLKADDDKEYKILRYEEMIPYLVEAIKEQQKQIEELKNG